MVTIDLNQNGLALVNQAKLWARQLGLDSKAIANDMLSGDNEHLREVFKEHFGNICKVID